MNMGNPLTKDLGKRGELFIAILVALTFVISITIGMAYSPSWTAACASPAIIAVCLFRMWRIRSRSNSTR
jgi:hypothetical protein